ncbi:Protein of uncharacterised function (DUF1341) [Citrobacter koseri]|uniref:Protein of uncharacterized function (DUF1341) n=1 Tax=Citrobacter koseri TaxID=545 RepID=A0A3S4M9A0_CITKO|nr:Protein of uncharacterised function (DUF1341) [Citrobacter koseri]
MKLTPNFYRDRVCLNVLAGSKENAREIYAAAEGHVLVGVLSKNYPDVDSAVAEYARIRGAYRQCPLCWPGGWRSEPVGDGERNLSSGAAAAR